MRLSLALVVLITCVLAAIIGGQRGRKVSGTVVSAATERPIANVEVKYEEGGTSQATLTDAKGYFEFPSGTLGTITVTATGFGTAYRRWPPRATGTLQIPLMSPTTLAGTVTAATTIEPVSGTVTALVRNPYSFVSTTVRVVDGVFRVDDIPSGPGIVVANAVGYAPQASRFNVAAGDWQDVYMSLPAEARVTGTVIDTEAKPVAGAHVIVTYSSTLSGAGLLADLIGGNTITNADGEFGIDGVVPDTATTLYANTRDSQTNSTTIMVGAGQVYENLTLRLQ